MGDIAFLESDNEQARQLFQQAMPLYDQIGDLLGKANCFWSLGDLENAAGQTELAKKHWQTALPLYQRINDRYSIGIMFYLLARVSEGQEQRQYVESAREVWSVVGYVKLVARLDKEFG